MESIAIYAVTNCIFLLIYAVVLGVKNKHEIASNMLFTALYIIITACLWSIAVAYGLLPG